MQMSRLSACLRRVARVFESPFAERDRIIEALLGAAGGNSALLFDALKAVSRRTPAGEDLPGEEILAEIAVRRAEIAGNAPA